MSRRSAVEGVVVIAWVGAGSRRHPAVSVCACRLAGSKCRVDAALMAGGQQTRSNDGDGGGDGWGEDWMGQDGGGTETETRPDGARRARRGVGRVPRPRRRRGQSCKRNLQAVRYCLDGTSSRLAPFDSHHNPTALVIVIVIITIVSCHLGIRLSTVTCNSVLVDAPCGCQRVLSQPRRPPALCPCTATPYIPLSQYVSRYRCLGSAQHRRLK